MPSYLLRYQAASFDDNVFDTQQLSGVRGASLSYLYSGELVERSLRNAAGLKNLQCIYTGASQGAFAFESAKSEAVSAKHTVERALWERDTKETPEDGHKPTGCHDQLAYVVALVEGGDSGALFQAESLCNVKKLQQGSFRLPNYDANAQKPGGRRDPRPAKEGRERSEAMHVRESFGRSQRQEFYGRMSPKRPTFDFTDDLQELIYDPDPQVPLSLRNKIALFYADGDKFGQRFKNAAKSGLNELGRVSTALKERQKQLLAEILDWLEAHRSLGTANAYFNEGRARFETLLWGGDEILFVMPSWLGLEFAQLFYENSGDWRLDGDKPWTFSSGLVICDHKTPIRQIKAVAEELAQRNKAMGGGGIQIEVFESLSMPDVDFDSYRRNLYFGDKTPKRSEFEELDRQLSIPGPKIGELIKKIARLKEADGMPRSQLYRLLHKASKAGAAAARLDAVDRELRDDFALWKKRAGVATCIDVQDVDALRDMRSWGEQPDHLKERVTTKRPAFSLSLGSVAMLWDYVRPLDFAETGRNG